MEILAGKDYDSLKDAVLHLVESSKPELFEGLLQPEQLVGKPSSCLFILQRTAAKVSVGEEFVRHKFISSLPANIAPVLAASSAMSLAQLGTLADNLVAFSKCNPVSHVQKHEFSSSSKAPNRHRPSFILVQACGLFTKANGPKFADPTYIMPKTQGHAGVGVSGLISNPAKFSRIQGQIHPASMPIL